MADLGEAPISRRANMNAPATQWRFFLIVFASTAAVAVSAATIPCSPQPLLLWNASASSPLGLYLVYPGTRAGEGDTVIAWAPDDARRLASSREYLPLNVPLVKRVAGATGDQVCARGDAVLINGRRVAARRGRDPSGRPLPWWSGCALLRPGDVFLLSKAPTAFDGRYFGITHAHDVIGQARLIWAA